MERENNINMIKKGILINPIFLKNKIKAFILFIYIFILFFDPPIISEFSIRNLLMLYGVIMTVGRCYLHCHVVYGIKVRNSIKYVTVIVGVLTLPVYYNVLVLNEIPKELYLLPVLKYYANFIALSLTSIFIISCAQRLDYDLLRLLKVIIWAAFAQSLISFMAVLFPSFKEFLVGIMVANSRSLRIREYGEFFYSIRGFGFAYNLFDMFGYFMSVVASIALFVSICEHKKKYWLISIFIFFSAAMNARTSFVIYFIGISFFLFMAVKLNKKKFVLTFFIMLILIMILCYITINLYHPEYIRWITSAWNSVYKYFFIGDSNTNDYMAAITSSAFWTLPDSAFALLFGNGHDLISGINGQIHVSSDVGYVNNIWSYGIVGSLLIYTIYVYIFGKCSKLIPIFYKYILAFLFVTFWVYMIKLNSIYFNPAILIFFIISFSPYRFMTIRNKKMPKL